jgi:AcrR family transcriptional regulator
MKSNLKKETRLYKGIKASERAEERRHKFLMAGIATFGTKGYSHTGIRDICSAAGLTERYFYESFETKEDLLIAIYRMIVEDTERMYLDILARTDIAPRERAAMAMQVFFARLLDDPCRARVQFFEVLGVSHRVDREYLDAMSLMSDYLALLTQEFFPGSRDEGPAAWIIPTSLTGAIVHIAMKWILNGYDIAIDDLVARLTDAFSFFKESAP